MARDGISRPSTLQSETGRDISLALDKSDNVHISYRDMQHVNGATNCDLKYARGTRIVPPPVPVGTQSTIPIPNYSRPEVERWNVTRPEVERWDVTRPEVERWDVYPTGSRKVECHPAGSRQVGRYPAGSGKGEYYQAGSGKVEFHPSDIFRSITISRSHNWSHPE